MSASVCAHLDISDVLDPTSTDQIEAITETSLLLGGAKTPTKKLASDSNRPYVFAALVAFAFVAQSASFLVMIPNLEVFRYIICQDYYAETGDLDLINLVGQYNGTVNERCAIDEISKKVANFQGISLFIENFSAILVVMPYGKLGDTYGRKIPMYVTLAGWLLSSIWFIVVVHKGGDIGINALLVPPIIIGLAGASPNIKALLYSMCCDCFDEASRLVALSWLSASLLICSIVAPAAGSWLLKHSLLWPLWGSLVCMITATLIFIALPETHPHLPDRSPSSASQLTNDEDMYAELETSKSVSRSLLDSIKSSFGALAVFTRGRNFMALSVIAICWDFGMLSFLVIAQFLNQHLGWSLSAVGYYLSAYNTVKIFVLLLALPLLTKVMLRRISSTRLDILLVQIGFLGETLAFVGYGIVQSWVLLPPILCFQSLASPMSAVISTLISKLAEPEEIGSMFAAFSVLDGLAESVGSPVMASIYSSTLSTYPGTVFMFVAVIYAIGLTASFFFDAEKMNEQSDATQGS